MTVLAKDFPLVRPGMDAAKAPVRADAAAWFDELEIEYLDEIADLRRYETEWRELAERALEANVIMAPDMSLAAVTHLKEAQGSAALIWRGLGPDRHLIGLFPVQESRNHWGLPVRAHDLWHHFYTFLGTPLIDTESSALVAQAFAEWLASSAHASGYLRFHLLSKGPVLGALTTAFDAHEFRQYEFDGHVRAVLETNQAADDYLKSSLGNKRIKEYRRLRNRLGDMGEVAFAVHQDPARLASALARFMQLEQKGWKGKRNTAMACRADWTCFLRETVERLGAAGNCEIAELTLDGRPVASTIIVSSGDTAWMWKIAYDETLAKFSPGVLLVLDVTRHLLADGRFARIDSCALPDHPMINHIWRERLGVTDLLVATGRGAVPAPVAAALESVKRGARQKLKAIYKTITRETHHG